MAMHRCRRITAAGPLFGTLRCLRVVPLSPDGQEVYLSVFT